MILLKDSAGPVAKTGAAAAKQTETITGVKESTTNKLLNLSPKKSVKTKKSNLKKNSRVVDEDIFCTQNQLLSIALKVNNIEEENKATQRAVALLKQKFNEFDTYKKDEQARNRERRF